MAHGKRSTATKATSADSALRGHSAQQRAVTDGSPRGARRHETGTRGVESWGTQGLLRIFAGITLHRCHGSCFLRGPCDGSHRQIIRTSGRNYPAESGAGGAFG